MNDPVVELEQLLEQYEIPKQEKIEILDDYKQMIEDGKHRGLSLQAIIDMVGNPKKITEDLGYDYKKNEKRKVGEKLIPLSPFVSFIIFMYLGLSKGLWHPGWLVFLLIPVTAIVVELGNSRDKHILTALSPFISSVIFFAIGFGYGIWHPTWLIFILIPLFGVINSRDGMDHLTYYTALSPFVSFIAFILIGYYTNAYHLAWLCLLLVILLGILHEKKITTKILLFTSFFASIALYLFIGYIYEDWMVALMAFSIFIVTGLLMGDIHITVSGMNNKTDALIVFPSIVLFLGVGYFFDVWAISWLFLLLIPVAMIIKYNEDRHILTPLSPFVSLAIFILLGYYYDLWQFSWIAFILIPVVAIIED
jgi:uncharacterized membrane protein